jgi:hypothetical protein
MSIHLRATRVDVLGHHVVLKPFKEGVGNIPLLKAADINLQFLPF